MKGTQLIHSDEKAVLKLGHLEIKFVFFFPGTFAR